jgi:hypothetical protein
MMSHKQREVLDQLMRTLHQKFPEVHLVSISELTANSYWITITEPSDEDEELKMVELLGELSTDALMDYGFDFQFVTTTVDKVAA